MSVATQKLDADAIRRDFPILKPNTAGQIPAYLDSAASSQKPKAVIDAIVEAYSSYYANVHRGVHIWSETSTDRYEQSRAAMARFLKARSTNEIVFTSGCTMAINLVAHGWGNDRVREGDEILVTEMEHHANIVPWQQMAKRTGAKVIWAPLTGDGRLDMDAFPKLLSEKTKLVAITSVSNVLGTINPIREIVALSKKVGAVTMVDGAQSAPHESIDVVDLDCDFLSVSGHKMLGPSGIGVLYGKEALLKSMAPFHGGGGMIRKVTFDGFEPADLPAKFEAGTPPIVPAIALGAAVEYLESVGMEAISEHVKELTNHAYETLANTEGIKIVGPAPPHRAGLVSFTVEGVHAHDVAAWLDRRGIAVRAGHHCTMPLHKRLGVTATSRASFYLYNTRDEVARLSDALREARTKFSRRTSQP